MSRGTAGTRASGRRGLTGWVPQTHAGFGPCRYRCLVSLQHNLPASGDMCVSVLSRLCTVTPNMYPRRRQQGKCYRHSAPGCPTAGACGLRNTQAAGYCPRGHPVELVNGCLSYLRTFPGCYLIHHPAFPRLSRPSTSSTLRQGCLVCLPPWTSGEGGASRQSRGLPLPQSLPPALSCS